MGCKWLFIGPFRRRSRLPKNGDSCPKTESVFAFSSEYFASPGWDHAGRPTKQTHYKYEIKITFARDRSRSCGGNLRPGRDIQRRLTFGIHHPKRERLDL